MSIHQKWSLIGFITILFISGCLVPSHPPLTPPDSERNKSSVEQILRYRKIIQDTLPFKDIIWDATTSGDRVRYMVLKGDCIFVETQNLKLRAYSTEIGHNLWILTLPSALDFFPCVVEEIPQQLNELRTLIKNTMKDIEDAEQEKGRDEKKIRGLKDRLQGFYSSLKQYRMNDFVYIISKGTISCIDRWTGMPIWQKKLSFIPSHEPVATLSTIYLSALDSDRIYLFDVAKRFERDWIKLDSQVVSKLVYKDPAMYFACENGSVYALNTQTHKEIWHYPTERLIKSDILVDDNNVYVGSTDFALYGIDRHLGILRWKYEVGLPIATPPDIGIRTLTKGNQTTVERTLFFHPEQKEELYALLLNPLLTSPAFQVRWKFPEGKNFLMYGLTCAYVIGKNDQILYALDIEKGTVLYKYSLRDFPFRAVDRSQGILYLGTADGYLFATREPPPQW